MLELEELDMTAIDMGFLRANHVWRSRLSDTIKRGGVVISAGSPTRELLCVTTIVDSMFPLVTEPRRGLGYKFMAAEAAWILSGDSRTSTIAPYSKKITDFSDDGVTFFGAYGPKIMGQWEYCKDELKRDIHTRRAVINIWRENPRPTKDYPCTTGLQFIARGGVLDLIVTMRSNDLWLGWVYDTFTQCMLIHAMVGDLATDGVFLSPGRVHLTAGSSHVYERDVANALYVLELDEVPVDYHHVEFTRETVNTIDYNHIGTMCYLTETAIPIVRYTRQTLVDMLWNTADHPKYGSSHDLIAGRDHPLDIRHVFKYMRDVIAGKSLATSVGKSTA